MIEQVGPDLPSCQTWADLGVPVEWLRPDNWWSNGPTGPCGPDSELFAWTGDDPPQGTPGTDGRWMELWNHVTMSYWRHDDDSLEPLPQRSVDTGMGLERLLMVVQGQPSVFDCDVFQPWRTALTGLWQCYSPGKREARPSGNNQSRAFHRLRFCPWRGNSFFDEAMWASFLAGQSRALFGCFMAVAFTLLISNASAGSTPVRHVRHRQHAYEARPVDVPLQPFSLDPPLPHPSTPIQVAYYAPPAVRRAEPIIHEEEDDVHAGFEMAGTSCPMVSGNRAVLRHGIAYAPSNAPDRVKNAIWAVNTIRNRPYVWGGGHGSFSDSGYDCSGAVSFALHYAGVFNQPLASSDLLRYGERGRGRWITIYSRRGHTFARLPDCVSTPPTFAMAATSDRAGTSMDATVGASKRVTPPGCKQSRSQATYRQFEIAV